MRVWISKVLLPRSLRSPSRAVTSYRTPDCSLRSRSLVVGSTCACLLDLGSWALGVLRCAEGVLSQKPFQDLAFVFFGAAGAPGVEVGSGGGAEVLEVFAGFVGVFLGVLQPGSHRAEIFAGFAQDPAFARGNLCAGDLRSFATD